MMIALTLFGFKLTNKLSMGHIMYFITLSFIKVTESEKYIRFHCFFFADAMIIKSLVLHFVPHVLDLNPNRGDF